MNIRILWASPAERRFAPGDILTDADLSGFDLKAADLIDAGEAEAIQAEEKPKARKKGAE